MTKLAGNPGFVLSAADQARAARLVDSLMEPLIDERGAVALCAIGGALSIVLAELQSRQHMPPARVLAMLWPLVEFNADRLCHLVPCGPVGHA
jgi:hypothetical protein